MNSKIRYTFNIFFLITAILWPLLKLLYFRGIDGAGRVEIMLMVLALFVNGPLLFKTPQIINVWLLWIIYCTIVLHFKGFYSETNTFSNWVITRLIFPYVCMLVSYRAFMESFVDSSKLIFYCYLLYVILGAFATNSVDSYDVGTRLENEMGNTFFNTAIFLGMFVSLTYSEKKIGKKFYWIVLIFLSFLLLLSGERKGLIALFVIIIGSLYGIANEKMKKMSLLSLLLIIGTSILFMKLAWTFSSFGERMSNSMETSDYSNSLFLKLMGDRGVMYVEGWALFLQNCWYGIGLNKYGLYNSAMYGLPLHTEYMVQLCECGLWGSSMFVLFYGGIIKRLVLLLRHDFHRAITMIIFFTFMAIIIINFVTWTYDNPNYFMVYGLIYAYYDKMKQMHITRL